MRFFVLLCYDNNFDDVCFSIFVRHKKIKKLKKGFTNSQITSLLPHPLDMIHVPIEINHIVYMRCDDKNLFI
jgi:hypothetical protein